MPVPRRLWVVATLAFLAHVAFLLIVPPIPIQSDASFYDLAGRNIASGRGIATGEGPLTAVMPAYPLFIGALYTICGDHPWVVRIAQSLLVALAAAGTFLVARRWGNRAATVGFLAVALLPAWFIYPGTLNAETLLLAAEVLFLALTLRDSKNTFAWGVTSGGACGLLALIKPEFIIWLPLPILVRGQRRLVTTAIASALGFAVALSPWVIRNAYQFHRFIPLSTHSGHTLWLSAHQPELTEFSSPEFNAALARCRKTRDPKATDDCLLADAKRMVAQHPGYFLKTSLGRGVHTLFGSHTDCLPHDISIYSFAQAWRDRRFGILALKGSMLFVQTLFVLGGMLGIGWLCRRRRHWFLAYLLGSKLAVAALIFGTSRYGLHLTPIFAVGWGALGSRLWPTSPTSPDQRDFPEPVDGSGARGSGTLASAPASPRLLAWFFLAS